MHVHLAFHLGWSRVRSSGPARFFHGDKSWNHFYGHSLPAADRSRAVVSYWWKDLYLVVVNRLGSLTTNSVIRLTIPSRHDPSWRLGRKTTNQTKQIQRNFNTLSFFLKKIDRWQSCNIVMFPHRRGVGIFRVHTCQGNMKFWHNVREMKLKVWF